MLYLFNKFPNVYFDSNINILSRLEREKFYLNSNMNILNSNMQYMLYQFQHEQFKIFYPNSNITFSQLKHEHFILTQIHRKFIPILT